MALPRKTVSPRNLALLERDLGYGAPVLYRRVPGAGRKYYDPKRPELDPVSEDYYLRVYKPALQHGITLRPGTPEQRTYSSSIGATARINEAAKQNVRLQRNLRKSLYSTWLAKRKAEGRPVTKASQAVDNVEFNQLYNALRNASYQARHQNRLENEQRMAAFNPGSEYSNLLIALGRRTGNETFPIGESPKYAGEAGSYIDTVVLPALNK